MAWIFLGLAILNFVNADNNLPKLHTHSNFEHGSSGSLQCQIDKATKGRVSVRKDGAEVAHFIVPDGYPFVIPERYNRYNITYDSVQSAVSLHIMDVQFDQDKGRYTCGQADGKESNPINVVVHRLGNLSVLLNKSDGIDVAEINVSVQCTYPEPNVTITSDEDICYFSPSNDEPSQGSRGCCSYLMNSYVFIFKQNDSHREGSQNTGCHLEVIVSNGFTTRTVNITLSGEGASKDDIEGKPAASRPYIFAVLISMILSVSAVTMTSFLIFKRRRRKRKSNNLKVEDMESAESLTSFNDQKTEGQVTDS